MLGLPFAFGAPWVLLGLLALPAIWWLLRLTPPRPREEVFPPTRILERLAPREETPATSPWWLTALRLALAALVILALAQPVWRPTERTVSGGSGPVMLVLDNAWTAGRDWPSRVDTARRIIAEAEGASRTVMLVPTVGVSAEAMEPVDAATARERLGALEPQPVPPELATLTERLADPGVAPGTIVWLSSGLAGDAPPELAAALRTLGGPSHLFAPSLAGLAVVHGVDNAPEAMRVSLNRATATLPAAVSVQAYDAKSRLLGEAVATFGAGEADAVAALDLPVELRNDIARVAIADADQAGAVALLDERFRRRRVGLISGENADRAQPLLSPLYYISRALQPFADVRPAPSANVSEAVPQLIEEGASALVLADIGNLPDEAVEALDGWVDSGGMLIRFAGPRLAAGDDDTLVPVRLRRGNRQLGGSLTWDQPQSLAAFDADSPFAGLPVPDDVTVSQQVLAEPGIDLAERTWASLADGTPLVTAARRGEGYVVLIHVTADASWSNLALSGAFVDMLRRLVAVSSGALAADRTASGTDDARVEATPLPPLRVLNGRGEFTAPSAAVKPLLVRTGEPNVPGAENPPGLYGTNDAFQALNLFRENPALAPLDAAVLGVAPTPYETEAPLDIKPWLLALAVLFLLADCIAVLWMAGAFRRVRNGRGVAAALAVMLAATVFEPVPVRAQDTSLPPDIASTLKTRLAYVETGDPSIDAISEKGLDGLTRFLASRTALEPGRPVGLDLSTDELAFYPLIYWPVDAGVSAPNEATMARVDAFMKGGGTVLFDTRDQASGFGAGVSANTQRLREILAELDVPALEPVPENHVMTRAFYLLDTFPGRYQGGQLWVEASAEEADRPARRGDGVSSIMITSNDFAGAWALEPAGGFTLPTVPNSPLQRTYAYRTGVNIAMYTLTGNYKADQVHIPALLERLGQ